MDKVMHFEIPADDVARAQKFYAHAFGWKMNPVPNMNYAILKTGPTDDEGMPQENGFINGGMLKRQSPVQHPVITICVENSKKAIETIKKAGGQLIDGPNKVGNMGFASYFKDTEGNVMGLWEPILSDNA